MIVSLVAKAEDHVVLAVLGVKERPSVNRLIILAKYTVMGGQQVCSQACRPCNDGDVTVTTK